MPNVFGKSMGPKNPTKLNEQEAQPQRLSGSHHRGEGPSTGSLDELLDVLPKSEHHRGRFGGYQAARSTRRKIMYVFGAAVLFAIGSICWYVNKLDYERKHPFVLPASSDSSSRTRELHWTEGQARLGISREEPGAAAIYLPDIVITLKEGEDRAQVVVDVVEGETVLLERVVGEIVVSERYEQAH